MAKKISLTRPELKRQRDVLTRCQRYLPMLKLKQQQLQLTLRTVSAKLREATAAADAAREKFVRYEHILADVAGVDVRALSTCSEIRTSTANVAGLNVPVFEGVEFPKASYSLFATPPWVDRAIADLRDVSRHEAAADILAQQHRMLCKELAKVVQRVNLFEKIKIPEALETIRVIRIRLGDEMTAAVGRAKIAKSKLAESERAIYEPDESDTEAEMQPA